MKTAKFEEMDDVGNDNSLEKTMLRHSDTSADGFIVQDYCLLLPFHSSRVREWNNTYAMIDHKWLTLNGKGDMNIACLCSELY